MHRAPLGAAARLQHRIDSIVPRRRLSRSSGERCDSRKSSQCGGIRDAPGRPCREFPPRPLAM
jgi:hypothetical protein